VVIPKTVVSSTPRSALIPDGNAVQYFCHEGAGVVISDNLGNGPDLTLQGTGSTIHLSDESGWFTGANGVSGNTDRYFATSDDYVNEVLRTDNLTGDESVMMMFSFIQDAAPAAHEQLMSFGTLASGFVGISNQSTGAIQIEVNGGSSKYQSHASGAVTVDVVHTFLVHFRNETRTFDFYIDADYTAANGIKSDVLGDGIAPGQGLALFTSLRSGSPGTVFGKDATRTARMADIVFVRNSNWINGARVANEYHTKHRGQLMSLR